MYSSKLFVVLLAAVTAFYNSCEGRTVSVRAGQQDVAAVEGSPLAMSCTAKSDVSPSPTPFVFKYWSASGAGATTVYNSSATTITSKTKGLSVTSTLTFKALKVADTQEYFCITEGKQTFMEVFVLPVASVPTIHMSKTDAKTIGAKTTLSCNASAAVAAVAPKSMLKLAWTFSKVSYTNGTDITSKAQTTSDNTGNPRTVASSLTRTVNKDTAGYYHCSVVLDVQVKNAVYNYVKNSTIELPVSVSQGVATNQKIKIFQKKEAKMVCDVAAFPDATATWMKDKEPITAASNKRYKFSSHGTTKNGVFVITTTDFVDRAVYTCTASNSVSSVSLKFTLRIRDPLGALWPFIGILIEAVLLAIIIIAYEKYGAKKGKKGSKGAKERLETSPLIDKSKDPGIEYTAGGKGRDDSVRMRGDAEVKA